jgi:hypothetical protein
MFAEAASAAPGSEAPQSARTQNSSFQVLVAVQVLKGLTLLLHSDTGSFQHESRSSQCNKSMHGIKAVTVQLNTRPQHIGDGVAGAGGAPGAWRPQPAPARRAGTMIWAEISQNM